MFFVFKQKTAYEMSMRDWSSDVCSSDLACARFVETIPMAERQPYLAKRHGSVNQGYFPIKQTTIIHPDLVEGWVFCRRAFDLDNKADFDPAVFWPRPQSETIFRALVQAQEPLIAAILQSIPRLLGSDPPQVGRAACRERVGSVGEF